MTDEENACAMSRTRFECRTGETQWRGLDRPSYVAMAGVALVSAAPLGIYALGVPIIIMFIAAMWLQSDMRMGSNSTYLRYLEEEMFVYDGVDGYEKFLDLERQNCPKLPFTSLPFTSISPRVFPAMQLMAMGAGLRAYFQGVDQQDPLWAIMVIAALDIIVTVLTLINVKHIREPRVLAHN